MVGDSERTLTFAISNAPNNSFEEIDYVDSNEQSQRVRDEHGGKGSNADVLQNDNASLELLPSAPEGTFTDPTNGNIDNNYLEIDFFFS